MDASYQDAASVRGGNVEGDLVPLESDVGDAPTTCNVLQLLRKQYSQKKRRTWSTEAVRRLWKYAVDALRECAAPEVAARACQLIEVLGQNCKSCIDGEWETVFYQDAPREVILMMEKFPLDLTVRSSSLRALLSMSGCMTCRTFYDKETQDVMQRSNAISALIRAMKYLQQLTSKMQFETNAHKLARLAIADAVQALHYICLLNKENLMKLASIKELSIIQTSIEDNLNELTVQEHGCMLLAELVTSAVLSDQEILECVGTVTNVARLQVQEKCIEVARAAVWSLAFIASNTLHPCNRRGSDVTDAGQLWPIMQEQVLSMIMGMLQSCQLKNDPLVKHCLDFIAVVGGEDGLLAPNAKTLERFTTAKALVHDVFMETDDMRIKAISMRTLYRLMRNPHQATASSRTSLKTLVQTMNAARKCSDASEKDIFCIQVFGLTLVSLLDRSEVIPQSDQISQYIQDVHGAIGYITRYIDEGGEEFFFDNSNASERAVEVSCCRYACHCCFIHESCSIHEIIAAVMAVAKLLSVNECDGVNSVDSEGMTVLHKLAKAGLQECLEAFVRVCGEDLDFVKRTPDGANAFQLAHVSRDPSSASVLERMARRGVDHVKDAHAKEIDQLPENAGEHSEHALKSMAIPSIAEISSLRFNGGMDGSKESINQDVNWSKELELTEKQQAEYERTLAERRRQLEDMEAASMKKSPCDLIHRHEEKRSPVAKKERSSVRSVLSLSDVSPSRKTSRFFAGNELLPQSTSGEGLKGGLASPDTQKQPQLFWSSASIGSAANNSFPDPVAAPAGPFDDRIVDSSLSAFHERSPRLSLALTGGDEKISSTWHSLFAADSGDASHGLLSNKWSMMSSSSAQNNHLSVEGDRQSGFIQQQMWPPLSGHPQRRDYQQHGPPSASLRAAGESATRGINEDDAVDDTQIMSWLSSEITGLIGNGSPDRVTEMRKCDFSDFVPPPPPQNAPSFDSLDDAAGFVSLDPSMSPFYSSNPVVSPYMHPSPKNFVNGQSTPWNAATPNAVAMDPRLVPQSELCGAEGRSNMQPSRFWHTEENDIPSKHLWLGNLNTRLPRSVLKSVFEEYGPIEDVVTFPGRMYAFVNFIQPEDAQRAAKELDNMNLPVLTGNRRLVIKFRPNRKALGRVGDLMPGVNNIEESNSGAIAPSISVPVFRSPDLNSPQRSGAESASGPQPYVEAEHPHERSMFGEREDGCEASESGAMMGTPCRHLWLGNVCVRPSKTVLFSLFSRFGPVESVRVFPGKTFAFVNFYGGEHACRAKEALDGKILAAVTGTKPLVVRYQREGAGPAGWARMHDNFPPLQTAESAPGAYVSSNVMVSPGKPCLAPHGEYGPPSCEAHRQSSLSPEDFPSVNRQTRTSTDSNYFDPFQAVRAQRVPASESEITWPESMASGMGVGFGEGIGMVDNSTAIEASSIGQLTRTLSATVGKGRPSLYARPPPLDRNSPWTTSLETQQDDGGLTSSLSANLNASPGFDGAEYTSPFFYPQMAPSHLAGSLGGHSWMGAFSDARPQNSALDHRMGLASDMTSQALLRNHESCNSDPILSLPQELFIASGGASLTQVATEMDTSQQRDGPGFVPSAVISCDKSSIW